jgi:membrane dipeptidase
VKQIVCRSVYVSCADSSDEGKDFLNATWRVRCVYSIRSSPLPYLMMDSRDTLEQIDVAKGLIEKYPDVRSLAPTMPIRD